MKLTDEEDAAIDLAMYGKVLKPERKSIRQIMLEQTKAELDQGGILEELGREAMAQEWAHNYLADDDDDDVSIIFGEGVKDAG